MTRLIRASIGGLAMREESFDIEFNRDVNVFWGLNGSGKTTLLKILHSALALNGDILEGLPFKNASVTFYSENFENEFTRVVHKIPKGSPPKVPRFASSITGLAGYRAEPEDDTSSDEQYTYEWITFPGKPPARSMRHRYLPTSRLSDTIPGYYASSRRRVRPEDLTDEAVAAMFAEIIEKIWISYNNDSLSRVQLVQQNGIAKILSSVLLDTDRASRSDPQALGPGHAYRLVRTFFRTLQINVDLGSAEEFSHNYETNTLWQQVVREVRDIQSEVDEIQAPLRHIERLISELFSGGKRVSLNARGISVSAGEVQIPVSSLSSGEIQVLRMFVECLAGGTSTIIVDEPELSMHVDWQRRLIGCLQSINPQAQIVFATHSPEIMADISDGEIFEL